MVNDDQVLAVTGAMAPAAMLRLTRQVLLIRLCRKTPKMVMQALFVARGAKRSWMKAVERDIELLVRTSVFQDMAGCCVAQWCNAIRGNPASFKKKLRLAGQDPEICSRAA